MKNHLIGARSSKILKGICIVLSICLVSLQLAYYVAQQSEVNTMLVKHVEVSDFSHFLYTMWYMHIPTIILLFMTFKYNETSSEESPSDWKFDTMKHYTSGELHEWTPVAFVGTKNTKFGENGNFGDNQLALRFRLDKNTFSIFRYAISCSA